jgi:hypothetical protein
MTSQHRLANSQSDRHKLVHCWICFYSKYLLGSVLKKWTKDFVLRVREVLRHAVIANGTALESSRSGLGESPILSPPHSPGTRRAVVASLPCAISRRLVRGSNRYQPHRGHVQVGGYRHGYRRTELPVAEAISPRHGADLHRVCIFLGVIPLFSTQAVVAHFRALRERENPISAPFVRERILQPPEHSGLKAVM